MNKESLLWKTFENHSFSWDGTFDKQNKTLKIRSDENTFEISKISQETNDNHNFVRQK